MSPQQAAIGPIPLFRRVLSWLTFTAGMIAAAGFASAGFDSAGLDSPPLSFFPPLLFL